MVEKKQTAEEFCRYIWQKYLVERRYDIVGEVISGEISVIGTGAHEFCRNLEEFISSMTRESQEWDGRFIIQDQWYQTRTLSEKHALVIGEIVVKEDGEDGILYDVRFRFSILLEREEDGWKLLHIHQSVPDSNQASDEFFPHHMVEKNNQQVIYNLRHDTMTGLWNRLYVKETIDRFAADKRSGMLLMLDVDKFKHMNDSFGHPFGDNVLIALSQSLMASFPRAVIGRVGGDEFVVYLSGIETPSQLEPFLMAFQKDWQERQLPLKLSYEITVSTGVSICPRHGDRYDALWRNADEALYRAKDSGAGQVRYQK